MKTTVKFDIDTDLLPHYSDDYVAAMWAIAQANPAPIEDRVAGTLAEYIGREIIRRWLKDTPPVLWAHQGHHSYSKILSEHGRWVGPNHETWVPNPAVPAEPVEGSEAS